MVSGLLTPSHVVIVLVVAVVLFGTRRLPELARSLGAGMREFKDSVAGEKPELDPSRPPLRPTDPSRSAGSRR